MPPKPSKMENPSKSGKANRKTQKSVSSRENTYERTTCDAVLLAESKIGDDREMKEEAEDALEHVLREEALYVEDVRGELFIGNHRGLDLARVSAEVRAVKDEIASQNEELSRQNKNYEDMLSRQNKKHEDVLSQYEDKLSRYDKLVTQLRTQAYYFEVSSSKYMELRNRYISTFKRDKLGLSNCTDNKIIKKGNESAHGPNAILDAALYTVLKRRSDTETFETLYGLNPSLVSGLREYQLSPSLKIGCLTCSDHKPTIEALNTHAGIISSLDKVGSDKFYKLFAEFIKLLKESNCDKSSLEVVSSKCLKRACSTFVGCVKDEVHPVDLK